MYLQKYFRFLGNTLKKLFWNVERLVSFTIHNRFHNRIILRKFSVITSSELKAFPLQSRRVRKIPGEMKWREDWENAFRASFRFIKFSSVSLATVQISRRFWVSSSVTCSHFLGQLTGSACGEFRVQISRRFWVSSSVTRSQFPRQSTHFERREFRVNRGVIPSRLESVSVVIIQLFQPSVPVRASDQKVLSIDEVSWCKYYSLLV